MAIACGARHSLVATRTGAAYSFGEGSRGQLGVGAPPSAQYTQPSPLEVGRDSSLERLVGRETGAVGAVHAIAAGSLHSLLLDEHGVAHACGAGGSGRLGTGLDADEPRAVALTSLRGIPMASAAAGDAHSAFLGADGRLFTCGRNASGQLGQGDCVPRHWPTLVQSTAVANQAVVAIYAAGERTLCLLADGRLIALVSSDAAAAEAASHAPRATSLAAVPSASSLATEWPLEAVAGLGCTEPTSITLYPRASGGGGMRIGRGGTAPTAEAAAKAAAEARALRVAAMGCSFDGCSIAVLLEEVCGSSAIGFDATTAAGSAAAAEGVATAFTSAVPPSPSPPAERLASPALLPPAHHTSADIPPPSPPPGETPSTPLPSAIRPRKQPNGGSTAATAARADDDEGGDGEDEEDEEEDDEDEMAAAAMAISDPSVPLRQGLLRLEQGWLRSSRPCWAQLWRSELRLLEPPALAVEQLDPTQRRSQNGGGGGGGGGSSGSLEKAGHDMKGIDVKQQPCHSLSEARSIAVLELQGKGSDCFAAYCSRRKRIWIKTGADSNSPYRSEDKKSVTLLFAPPAAMAETSSRDSGSSGGTLVRALPLASVDALAVISGSKLRVRSRDGSEMILVAVSSSEAFGWKTAMQVCLSDTALAPWPSAFSPLRALFTCSLHLLHLCCHLLCCHLLRCRLHCQLRCHLNRRGPPLPPSTARARRDATARLPPRCYWRGARRQRSGDRR